MKQRLIQLALAAVALSAPVAVIGVAGAQSTKPAAMCSAGQPVNANAASDAVLLKLPGVGPRILKEIKEYRPYKNVTGFRREIGKYLKGAALEKLVACVYVK